MVGGGALMAVLDDFTPEEYGWVACRVAAFKMTHSVSTQHVEEVLGNIIQEREEELLTGEKIVQLKELDISGHYFTDINRITNELNWLPKYDLEKGLKDSFKNDYLLNQSNLIDFSLDEKLISS